MSSQRAKVDAADSRAQRYRQAEQELWNHYGVEPTERFVELDSPRARLRVVETGSGQPILFIPGSGGTGPYWGPLVRELPGFRCIMIDRPGWGLSSPLDYQSHEYKAVVGDLLGGLLDALDLERCHLVGASIGNTWALALALAQPSRVERIVLLGGAPLLADVGPPTFIRLLASPVGAVMVRVPPKPARLRSILRQIGHGPTVDTGRLDQHITWRVAFERDTDSMRHEREMVRALVRGNGYRPGLTFDTADLGAVKQPTLMICGTADPVGTVDIWERTVGLLARAELHLLAGAGHMPWLDEPNQAADHIRRFLTP